MRLLPILAAGVLASALAAPASGESDGPVYELETEFVWRTPLERGGVSSPRAADLNGDGLDDVVLGTGFEDRWGEAVALDGKTGRILWKHRVADEVLVAVPFLDVDGDEVPDVFIGGRKKLEDVYALSGKTGETIWQLTEANPRAGFLPVNFINLLLVDDRDADGLADLLVVQSGGRDTVRYAARFYWVSSATGKLLASAVSPDGKECYSMPLFQHRSGKPDRFYIGTGGETLSGSLLKLRYPSLEEEWRIRAIGGGFIGSPSVVDLDGDGTDELVASSMHGAVYRLDADSGSIAWQWRERPYWTYVSPVVGAFNAGPTLDVVAGFNHGTWPTRDRTKLVWLDGDTGEVISSAEFEGASRFTAASPLVLDVDHDGRDETLIVLSNPVPETVVADESHVLLMFDGGVERRPVLEMELDGYSVSTPRLADLDANGKLDIIHSSYGETMRIELTVSMPSPRLPRVRRGELRGPNGAGIQPPRR